MNESKKLRRVRVTVADGVRLRKAPNEGHELYSRRVRGQKHQLRWWVSGAGSVGLGLYDNEEVLLLVRRAVFRELGGHEPQTALELWRAFRRARAALVAKGVPGLPDAMPMFVRRAADGSYFASPRPGMPRLPLPGEPSGFTDPEKAHLAFLESRRS